MTTEFNIENYLNFLPKTITKIVLNNKNLTYLPNITRFKYLKHLELFDNQLTSLPELPENLVSLVCCINQLIFLPELPKTLKKLYCSDNQLTSLPNLPESLTYLNCDNNQLTYLPELPKNIKWILFKNNIIYEIIYDLNIEIIKKNIKTINKFRKLHYFIKIKYWLYKYVLKYIIEKKYHPEKLIQLLTTNDNLENAIENW